MKEITSTAKYLMHLSVPKGKTIALNQSEYVFWAKTKAAKKDDSIYIKGRYIALWDIAFVEKIKDDYMPDERTLLTEKSEGKPLSKETFEKTKAEIYSRFKTPTK